MSKSTEDTQKPLPKILKVRLTPHEALKLRAFAEKHGRTVSGVIHEYIRRIPNP